MLLKPQRENKNRKRRKLTAIKTNKDVTPLNGWDWIWVGLGIAADVMSYMGATHKRQQIPGYPENDPIENI